MGEKDGVGKYSAQFEQERRKLATLYLLENEGFHSGKDEGNITKAAQRHNSNPAWHPNICTATLPGSV